MLAEETASHAWMKMKEEVIVKQSAQVSRFTSHFRDFFCVFPYAPLLPHSSHHRKC